VCAGFVLQFFDANGADFRLFHVLQFQWFAVGVHLLPYGLGIGWCYDTFWFFLILGGIGLSLHSASSSSLNGSDDLSGIFFVFFYLLFLWRSFARRRWISVHLLSGSSSGLIYYLLLRTRCLIAALVVLLMLWLRLFFFFLFFLLEIWHLIKHLPNLLRWEGQ
jgi:hypothetical protein